MKGTVVLGFSGGVDSACAAALLCREGWDVRALYPILYVAKVTENED